MLSTIIYPTLLKKTSPEVEALAVGRDEPPADSVSETQDVPPKSTDTEPVSRSNLRRSGNIFLLLVLVAGVTVLKDQSVIVRALVSTASVALSVLAGWGLSLLTKDDQERARTFLEKTSLTWALSAVPELSMKRMEALNVTVLIAFSYDGSMSFVIENPDPKRHCTSHVRKAVNLIAPVFEKV